MMTINPHEGVDAIRFGMRRNEVERALRVKPKRGRRNQFELSDHDFFEPLGMFVYYDREDRCNAIEFTGAATVSYEGFDLFGHSAAQVCAWARGRDPDLVVADGFRSLSLGLSMYAPWLGEDDVGSDERLRPAESFLAFARDYPWPTV